MKCGFLDMEHDRQIFFVILGHVFENQNFEKNEKNTSRYYHFTNVYHK